MTVYEVALGVGWAITIVWGFVIYLMQMIRIEELEEEINGCKKEVKSAKKNR